MRYVTFAGVSASLLILLAAAVSLTIVGAPSAAVACDCPAYDVADVYADAERVLIVRLRQAEQASGEDDGLGGLLGSGRTLVYDVLETLKGPSSETLKLEREGLGGCFPSMMPGNTAIFYLAPADEDGEVPLPNICTGSYPLTSLMRGGEAAELLEVMGGTAPTDVAPFEAIVGKVRGLRRYLRQTPRVAWSYDPAAGKSGEAALEDKHKVDPARVPMTFEGPGKSDGGISDSGSTDDETLELRVRHAVVHKDLAVVAAELVTGARSDGPRLLHVVLRHTDGTWNVIWDEVITK